MRDAEAHQRPRGGVHARREAAAVQDRDSSARGGNVVPRGHREGLEDAQQVGERLAAHGHGLVVPALGDEPGDGAGRCTASISGSRVIRLWRTPRICGSLSGVAATRSWTAV